jgi:hypothetical protein
VNIFNCVGRSYEVVPLDEDGSLAIGDDVGLCINPTDEGPRVRIHFAPAASLRTIGSAAARMVVVSDLGAGDGRALPKPILQKTLMECTVSREAADTLNFRFNVSYLTRMRPPVKYHQKHERTSWRYGCDTFRSVRNDPVMLSLYCSRPGKKAQLCAKEASQKSTNVPMELAMINWPEMLRQAEDWAAGFWVGTATASLVGVIVAAATLLTHAI